MNLFQGERFHIFFNVGISLSIYRLIQGHGGDSSAIHIHYFLQYIVLQLEMTLLVMIRYRGCNDILPLELVNIWKAGIISIHFYF